MQIAVTGSTGLVGSALVPFLTHENHEVRPVVRRPAVGGSTEISWDPASGRLEGPDLEDCQAVVHLAGENIAAGRWTRGRKSRIRSSRGDATRLLAEALARLPKPPAVLVCASAVGFYGDRGEEILEEGAGPGEGFLAEVCQEWEEACSPAREQGIRVVNLRLGVILSPTGGALARMLLPFRLGLGGDLGSGRQYMSWIALDDVLGLIVHALENDDLQGPVNAVAPQPVTNAEFTRRLGRVLRRPVVFPFPAFVARLVFGELADALLLSGARVLPRRAQESGYEFQFPELEPALRHVLQRPAPQQGPLAATAPRGP